MLQYRLRTLVLLMAIVPPLVGFWPAIKRRVAIRATQISGADVVVVAAASTLVAIRCYVDLRGEISAREKT